MAIYRFINTNAYSDLAGLEVSNDSGVSWAAALAHPVVGDTVYCNNFVKTIDIDAFSTSFRSTAMTGVVAGGGFLINDGVTVVGDVINRQSVNMVTYTGTTAAYIIGDVFGGTASGNSFRTCFPTGTGTLHIVGNSTGGSTGGSTITSYPHGVYATDGNFIVYGDAIGISRGSGAVINGNGSGVVLGTANGVSAIALGAQGCTVSRCGNWNTSCIVTDAFVMPTNGTVTLVGCLAAQGSPVQYEVYDNVGAMIVLNPLNAQDQADPADVRLLTVYANGALTGTCAVPPAGAVSLGVPVGATTGTGSVTSAEIRDLILPSILSAITQP